MYSPNVHDVNYTWMMNLPSFHNQGCYYGGACPTASSGIAMEPAVSQQNDIPGHVGHLNPQ